MSYQTTYSDLYAAGYPPGPALAVWSWAASNLKWRSRRVIDVGCGHAILKKPVSKDAEYVGIDVSDVQLPEGCWQHNVVEDSIVDAFGDCDLAICCDVLEHIYETDLDRFIENVVAASNIQIFSISCRASRFKDADNNGLHVTIKPPAWWLETLSDYTDILVTRTMGSDLWVVCGDPKYLEDEPQVPVPTEIRGQRVRTFPDGSFGLIRPDSKAERLLDGQFKKVGKLRWAASTPSARISDLNIGPKVAIIGKGPSLDDLAPETLEAYDTVICINDSWPVAKEHPGLIVCQIDPGFGQKNAVAPMIVSQRSASEFSKHDKPVVVRNTHHDGRIGAAVAIGVAKAAGAVSIDFYAFDAITSGSLDYAESLGYPSTKGGDPKRFLGHRTQILEALGSLPHIFN